MSTRQNIEQKRAEAAHTFAKNGNDKYKDYLKKVPAMIRTNGLGNTVLFMQTKGSEWSKITRDIETWLNQQGLLPNDTDLFTHFKTASDAQVRAMTEETLALFNWLRRFAKD